MEASKCPKCGEEPQFLEHVEKWYCYGCNSYVGEGEAEHVCAPEAAPTDPAIAIAQELQKLEEEPELVCRNCGASLQNLKDGRLYCFMCEMYQDEAGSEPETEKRVNEAQALLETAIPPAAIEKVPETIQPAFVEKTEVIPVVQESQAVSEPEPHIETEAQKHAEVKMCSICGQPLKYIEKYHRHYCYGCRKYASKDDQTRPVASLGKSPSDARKCPDCGSELKYIEKYREHYCHSCKKYPLKTRTLVETKPAAPAASESALCQKCGEPLKFIEKYNRHYCYHCKEYAPKAQAHSAEPKEKKSCPTCHENMKYVSEYNEWYCVKCKKYSLRPTKPVLLF